MHSIWLSGPDFLIKADLEVCEQAESFELVEPSLDTEIRPKVTSLATKITEQVFKLEIPCESSENTYPHCKADTAAKACKMQISHKQKD